MPSSNGGPLLTLDAFRPDRPYITMRFEKGGDVRAYEFRTYSELSIAERVHVGVTVGIAGRFAELMTESANKALGDMTIGRDLKEHGVLVVEDDIDRRIEEFAAEIELMERKVDKTLSIVFADGAYGEIKPHLDLDGKGAILEVFMEACWLNSQMSSSRPKSRAKKTTARQTGEKS